MLSKLVLFQLGIFSLCAITINPGTPSNITSDNSVATPVNVAGSSTGFLAAWADHSAIVKASFSSDQGATWSVPVTVGLDSSYLASVACRGSTFLIAWTNTDVGFATGIVSVSHSTNDGATWSTPAQISPDYMGDSGQTNPPAIIAQNASGFMVAWTAADPMFTRNIWTNFSSDGSSWGTASQASSAMLGVNYDEISIAADSAGFLISWVHFSRTGQQAYTSYTTDGGMSWSSAVGSPQADDLLNNTYATVAASSEGFMMGWIDSSNAIYSSFTTDRGSTWSTKSLITSELAAGSNAIGLAAIGTDFIATWVDNMNTGWASTSSDRGVTWSAPVQITADGNVMNSYFNGVSVSTVASKSMFTWWSNDGNALSSSASFSPSSNPASDQTSTFFPQIIPNKPNRGLFNP